MGVDIHSTAIQYPIWHSKSISREVARLIIVSLQSCQSSPSIPSGHTITVYYTHDHSREMIQFLSANVNVNHRAVLFCSLHHPQGDPHPHITLINNMYVSLAPSTSTPATHTCFLPLWVVYHLCDGRLVVSPFSWDNKLLRTFFCLRNS